VFCIIVYYGVRSCLPHTETKRSLATTVVVFILWSSYSLYVNGSYMPSVISFSGGLLIGYLSVEKLNLLNIEKVSMGSTSDSLAISGSPLMLMMYVANFIANFMVGYKRATMPEVDAFYIFGMHVLSGASLGIVFMRWHALTSIIQAAAAGVIHEE